MPSFHSYGIHTSLELRDKSLNSISKSPRIPESTSKITWSPIQGMSHPIISTNIVSPAELSPPLPFCIVVVFDADNSHNSLNHLKGDVRIEVKIDGVVSGWRVLPRTKIWPKGTRIEFTGLRVARTEEMSYMFNPPPRNMRRSKTSLAASARSTPPTKVTNITETSTIQNPEDLSLVPFAPSGLSPNTSHIEILITVGKKHNTLEKYLIFSPVPREAFYIPPRSLSSKGLEHSITVITKETKRKLELQQSYENEEAWTSETIRFPYKSSITEGDGRLRGVWKQNTYVPKSMDKEMRGWKPIGFASVSQKTTQMREAEFTASMHLVRFWLIIYPEPIHSDQLKMPISTAPSVIFQGRHSNLTDTLVHNNKISRESVLNDSIRGISEMEDGDTVADRKRGGSKKMRSSEVNEQSFESPESLNGGKNKKHDGIGSVPVLSDGVSGIRDHRHSKPKIHLGSDINDIKSRSSCKQAKTALHTVVSSSGLGTPTRGEVSSKNTTNQKAILDLTKRVTNTKKKTD